MIYKRPMTHDERHVWATEIHTKHPNTSYNIIDGQLYFITPGATLIRKHNRLEPLFGKIIANYDVPEIEYSKEEYDAYETNEWNKDFVDNPGHYF